MIIFLVATGLMYNRHQVKAANSDKKDVIVESEIKELYTKETHLKVKVIANNKKLINENTYLSYHVYNKSGEVVLYENERIPIILDDANEMLLTISINLKGIPNKVLKNGVVIKFDIVDEEKAYWFSLDKSIKLEAGSITFENNYLKRVCIELKKEILDNQIVFVINLICFIAIVVVVLIVRRKHIFEL